MSIISKRHKLRDYVCNCFHPVIIIFSSSINGKNWFMSATESPARLSQMLQWPRVDRTPTHPEILIKKFIFSMIGKLHQVFIPFSKKKKDWDTKQWNIYDPHWAEHLAARCVIAVLWVWWVLLIVKQWSSKEVYVLLNWPNNWAKTESFLLL